MNAMTQQRLELENIRYHGTGGVSQNRSYGFWPAFMDTQTRAVYLSRFTDGRLAPFHILDGLPDELVLSRNPGGRGAIVKAFVVSGFIREGVFYSRDEAAAHAATMLETESAFEEDGNGSNLAAKPWQLERARAFLWRFLPSVDRWNRPASQERSFALGTPAHRATYRAR